MFDYFTPSNWFWIFMAILISCYVKIASARHSVPPLPSFAPASIISLF
ncbi:MAG: hypothetical protein KF802_00660 [Bdellovibrionaceae bacterium]|nr:hypothetical protein [Pseudobdellovibrionaceae bacterium]MBX3034986.1 hypothetical protein [Pseudobdellovibrionaceae bacterium]